MVPTQEDPTRSPIRGARGYPIKERSSEWLFADSAIGLEAPVAVGADAIPRELAGYAEHLSAVI